MDINSCCILLCSTWTLLKNYLDITALHFLIASAVFDMMVMLYLSWRLTPLSLLLVHLWGSQRYIFLIMYCIFKRFLIRFVFNRLLFEMNETKVSSIFSLMKSSKKYLIFLPAFYLIMCLMISPKNFEIIALLKIWQLVSFWNVKTHFGEIHLKRCIFRNFFFIFLPAFYLIMCFMKSPQNFEKIVILKKADFLLRCQNSLQWEICLICHWNIDSW